MIVILVIIAVLAALFAGSFLSKRRFGVLALGLTAGAIISPIWGETAGYVISAAGVVPEGPLVQILALSLIILVPAILFMFHGYSYKHIAGRIVGSLLFMILAAAFLVEPIGSAVAFTGPAGVAYEWVAANRELIISAGVVFAVVDFLFAKTVHKTEKKHR